MWKLRFILECQSNKIVSVLPEKEKETKLKFGQILRYGAYFLSKYILLAQFKLWKLIGPAGIGLLNFFSLAQLKLIINI